ncbi:acyl-CoA thioesterase [Sphingopyxis sp. QXT-31]|uniref:acyl-CoA thioesterase n=1 Tax=Sphingopyxis sp. QXT-31 TaxID=1357916 RepID=UPI0009790B09|nr:acyl-CoA thioesterase [Sphingopyxis sp. QXT-31]AQA00170.1 acyl-CoA thioesterase [Sphingopyxis sp. QXT-31]
MSDRPAAPACPRDPILRVVPRPADINANGHIFGGWVLSQMDIAGGIVAGRVAQGPVATVAIETMEFIAPILLRDIISIYAHLERRGRTSMAIRLEVVATRDGGRTEERVTEGVFTFVALDENHRPRPLPPI